MKLINKKAVYVNKLYPSDFGASNFSIQEKQLSFYNLQHFN